MIMKKYLDLLKNYLSVLLKVILTPKDQTLRYTTSNNKKLELKDEQFGAKIILHYYFNNEGVVYFESPITEIKGTAFKENDEITSIVIPNSVVTIGERAFCVCKHLTEIVLSDKLETIEYGAFGGSEGLKRIVIPDSVTTIGKYAFQECKGLSEVTMGKNVTTIGEKAFWCCDNLADIHIPEKVNTIGKYAFNATAITEISIPDGVTTLEEGAFRYCRKLKTLTVGKNVTNIGMDTFEDCESLGEIYCKAAVPPEVYRNRLYPGTFHLWSYSFETYIPSIGIKLYVPQASLQAYQTADFWKDYPFLFLPYDFGK